MNRDKVRKIRLKVLEDEGKVEIGGKKYPPTQHNLNVWRKYLVSGDQGVLWRLSTVVFDFN